MIVNMKDMLIKAKKGKYAVPQFNINNLEWARYVLEESQTNNSPVILGVSEGAIRYMGGYNVVVHIIKSLVHDLKITVPVAIHLDHGTSINSCISAINAGFTSVMLDASKEVLDENIKMTKEVMKYASKFKATVEAELGHIGGTEDDITSSIMFAKVDESIRFTRETKVDFLAPALGSVHGLYKGEPNLDFKRMIEISIKTGTPLVLHGGTGISDDKIKEAIGCGIVKININTELQIVWSNAVKMYLSKNPTVYDPRKIIGSGELAMKEAIKQKIILLGSQNQA
ncbi:MAG: class II fructose-1,6-bisphosphate aldolase [Bacilli bacterium]|nr:class II fructose-1,6-bisphosphate aldolase [Bacilli bacterium]MDD4607535.1 class II fructose-1,6-bisphosphate aldolase [Bacilli bacterium]